MSSKVSDLSVMAAATLAQDTDFIYVVDTSAGTSGSLKITPTAFLTDRTFAGTLTWGGITAANMVKFPDTLADALSFKEAGNFYLTFVTTNGSEAVKISQQLLVADTFGLTVGGSTLIATSNGDGTTALTPQSQIQGTTKTDSTLLLSCNSATATSAVAPSLAFLKSANATIGSNTVVASGEVLGEIVWFAADGTDFKSAAARIQCIVDATPGTGDMPGRLVFSTSIDGGETLTEALRITQAQILTTFAATPTNINAAGAIMPKGGVAITDVLNAWIDDSTHGSGTVSHLIGNATITTSSDSRIKKNVMPYEGALAALENAPRVVTFEYDHPDWGGDRAPEGDEDARQWGPNARGQYVGFLAQETIDWAPWVVNAGAGKDCQKCRAGQPCDDPTHPIWHVEYQHLVPLLVAAIKELSAKVEALENAGGGAAVGKKAKKEKKD